jgi:hypothetical protein
MKKRAIILWSLAIVLVSAPIVVPFFIPWTEINCEHQDINIKTGKARCSRYIWFIRICERTKDTPLSEALAGKTVDVAETKPWQHVHTFSPGVRWSPHYIFHSALYQVEEIRVLFETSRTSDEQKAEIARAVLTIWQTTGRDFGVHEYIRALKTMKTNQDQPTTTITR